NAITPPGKPPVPSIKVNPVTRTGFPRDGLIRKVSCPPANVMTVVSVHARLFSAGSPLPVQTVFPCSVIGAVGARVNVEVHEQLPAGTMTVPPPLPKAVIC